MNEAGTALVTGYTFKGGKEYIVKMKATGSKVLRRSLELTVTDKFTAEHWQSSYDSAYIENLTQKTGNYKQFDVFVAMLQSGLLKGRGGKALTASELQTSECIALDLLTFEDLELLRARRTEGAPFSNALNSGNNRRYLILTYTVEFDRIHYPLPLEYCGLPDPIVLQATIKKLQAEIEKLRTTNVNKVLQERVHQLETENERLIRENQILSKGGKGLGRLFNSLKILENNVTKERAAFRTQIQKLRSENASLTLRIRQLTEAGVRKPADGSSGLMYHSRPRSSQSRYSNRRRSRSRSSSASGRAKISSLSSGSSLESLKVHHSPCRSTMIRNVSSKGSKVDFESLESRIRTLQKMLKEGINLN